MTDQSAVIRDGLKENLSVYKQFAWIINIRIVYVLSDVNYTVGTNTRAPGRSLGSSGSPGLFEAELKVELATTYVVFWEHWISFSVGAIKWPTNQN